MNAGWFVGRVGGLAVALGVGAAVTVSLGQGIARADLTSQPSPPSGSSSSDSSPSGSSRSLHHRPPKALSQLTSDGAQRSGSPRQSRQPKRADNNSHSAKNVNDSTKTLADDPVTLSLGDSAGSPNSMRDNTPRASRVRANLRPSHDSVKLDASHTSAAFEAASGRDASGGELTPVALDTARPLLSTRGYATATLSPSSDTAQEFDLAATPNPVTLKSIATNLLAWSGLSALTPHVPLPNMPASSVLETLSLAAARERHRVSVLGRITISGYPSGVLGSPAVFSGDGSRALILTTASGATGAPTRMAVINTATGRQVGTTLTLDPTLVGVPVLSADGSHLFVTTSDATTTRVAVINTATSALTTTTFALPGAASSTLLNADGSRVLITTSDATTTRVAVINTATGAKTGTTLTVAGQIAGTVLSVDGSRVLVTTSDATNTRVAVINTATGIQNGTTLTLDGPALNIPVFSADGTRALITTTVYDAATAATSIEAAVINTATGAQTGTTFALPGEPSSPLFVSLNANGSRALITTHIDNAATDLHTEIAVMDTTAGAQIGTTLTVTGRGSPLLSADRTRAVIYTAASDSATGAPTTQVTAIDLATGAQTNTTLSGFWGIPLLGADYLPQLASTDGSRVLLTHAVTNPTTGAKTTQLVVIDTTTGAQIGTTLTLAGEEFGSRLVRPDGALIVTNVYDGRTSTNTTRLALIDTTTGMQIGPTTTTIGFLNGGVQFRGDRAVVTTISSNFATTGQATTEAAVINTTTGVQVGTTFTLDDDTGTAVMSADGTHAVVNDGRQLAVLDTATGIQLGKTVAGGSSAQPTVDGTRVVVTTPIYNFFTNSYKTKVAVLKIV